MKSQAFNQLIKKDNVNIKWSRYNIREFLKPMQCFNCYKYGHLAKYCKQKRKCQNSSSEGHETENCQEDTHCENFKLHNDRLTLHMIHTTALKIEIVVFLKMRSRIDYGSTN